MAGIEVSAEHYFPNGTVILILILITVENYRKRLQRRIIFKTKYKL